MNKGLTDLLLDDAQAHVSERGIDTRAQLDERIYHPSDNSSKFIEKAKSRFDDHRRKVIDR